MVTSAVCSLLSRGKREEQWGWPASHTFSRSPSSSFRRLPDLATILRLMTITAWLEGFLACRATLSPTRKSPGWARVIS